MVRGYGCGYKAGLVYLKRVTAKFLRRTIQPSDDKDIVALADVRNHFF